MKFVNDLKEFRKDRTFTQKKEKNLIEINLERECKEIFKEITDRESAISIFDKLITNLAYLNSGTEKNTFNHKGYLKILNTLSEGESQNKAGHSEDY